MVVANYIIYAIAAVSRKLIDPSDVRFSHCQSLITHYRVWDSVEVCKGNSVKLS